MAATISIKEGGIETKDFQKKKIYTFLSICLPICLSLSLSLSLSRFPTPTHNHTSLTHRTEKRGEGVCLEK